jgi:hypothetical protein
VKGAVAGDGEDDFAETSEFRGAVFEDFCFPAALGAVGFVHLIKIASEECGFVAAGAGTNFHDAGPACDGISGSGQIFQFDSERIALGLELVKFCASVFAGFVVGFFIDHEFGRFDVTFKRMETANGKSDFGERSEFLLDFKHP